MGTVEVLPRTLKLKKTAKPTKAKPTTSPTSSPTVLTALKIIDQTVSTLLPDGETDYDDPNREDLIYFVNRHFVAEMPRFEGEEYHNVYQEQELLRQQQRQCQSLARMRKGVSQQQEHVNGMNTNQRRT